MKEKISGLSIKLITSVLLLSVLLCAAISYMGYREFTTVLEDEYNRSAYEIAETAKSYLDPDRLEHYLETGEIDAAYLEIQDRLDALVVSTNSYLIYVTRLSNDYTTSTYIFDAVTRTAASPAMRWATPLRIWTRPIRTRWSRS